MDFGQHLVIEMLNNHLLSRKHFEEEKFFVEIDRFHGTTTWSEIDLLGNRPL